MKPITTVLIVGVSVVAAAYFVLPRVLTVAPLEDRREYSEYSARSGKEAGWAPVQLWWEMPPEIKGEWRAKKAARFTLTHGEAFAGDSHVPREKIRAFLDERVSRGEIDYVVVFPTKGTKWGEIFPVLDECRKSRVKIVLLNQYEA